MSCRRLSFEDIKSAYGSYQRTQLRAPPTSYRTQRTSLKPTNRTAEIPVNRRICESRLLLGSATAMRRPKLLLLLLCAPIARATLCSGSRLFDDAFLSGCTSVEGDLVIANQQAAALSGSLFLASVGGSLVVSSNSWLVNLTSLRVSEVVGDVVVQANRHLTHLTDPGALPSIGGDVSIFANAALTNLDGFAGSNISGAVRTSANPAHTSVEGLCDAVVAGSVQLEYNSRVQTSLVFCNVEGGVNVMANSSHFRTAVTAYASDPDNGIISYGDISTWDVSRVTDMSSAFQDATIFNADLSRWDTRSVTDMRSMFKGASSFGSDLNAWDVTAVTDMRECASCTTRTDSCGCLLQRAASLLVRVSSVSGATVPGLRGHPTARVAS